MASEDCSKCKLVSYPSVVDRYFKKRYKADVRKKRGEDQCVLVHSNRLCIVTIAPEHPILSENKTVSKVDFQVDKHTDRMENKVTGKNKRGAQWLTELAPICHVSCTDGSTYTLCSCVKGSLVEVNENLQTDPHLLTKKPQTDGYIAAVLTKLADHDKEMAKLLSPEAYEKRVEKRKLATLAREAVPTNPVENQDDNVPKTTSPCFDQPIKEPVGKSSIQPLTQNHELTETDSINNVELVTEAENEEGGEPKVKSQQDSLVEYQPGEKRQRLDDRNEKVSIAKYGER